MVRLSQRRAERMASVKQALEETVEIMRRVKRNAQFPNMEPESEIKPKKSKSKKE
jgi:hypothetical protein